MLRYPGHVRLAGIVALFAVAGCSSMSQQECASTDWRTVGYEDGVNGYTGNRIANYRHACGKYGVTPDLSSYQTGRAQGLREYCRPGNGYRVGAAGGGYNNVCPEDLEPAFLKAFNAGHELYSLEARVWNVDSQLEARRRELAGLEHGIVASSASVVSDASTGEQRAQAVLDAAQMTQRADRVREEIRQLEYDRVSYARELEEYRAKAQPPT